MIESGFGVKKPSCGPVIRVRADQSTAKDTTRRSKSREESNFARATTSSLQRTGRGKATAVDLRCSRNAENGATFESSKQRQLDVHTGVLRNPASVGLVERTHRDCDRDEASSSDAVHMHANIPTSPKAAHKTHTRLESKTSTSSSSAHNRRPQSAHMRPSPRTKTQGRPVSASYATQRTSGAHVRGVPSSALYREKPPGILSAQTWLGARESWRDRGAWISQLAANASEQGSAVFSRISVGVSSSPTK